MRNAVTAAKRETIYLVDVSGYIFRAYHAVRHLTNSKGVPTNAVFGFTQMLLKLIKDYQPKYVGMVFDISRKSFRTELYPQYKAHRPPPPEDLVPQFALIRDVVRAFDTPVIELENYEADDLIGTLARRFEREGHDVRVITSDKDLMQIVSDRVRLIDTWKNRIIGISEVEERFGVGPERVVDVLGLAGDASDNVPGVPGIGEKTAIQLVREFGSIEGLLSRLDEVAGEKRRANLRDNAEQARLSRRLVTLDFDAPIDIRLEDIAWNGPKAELITPLFKELEFNRLLAGVDLGYKVAPKLDRDSYTLVDSEEKFTALLERLSLIKSVTFDTETNTLNPLAESPLVGLAFSPQKGESYYVPVAHVGEGVVQLDKAYVLERLKPLFADPQRTWIAQNAKFDMHVLESEGVVIGGRVDDTMLMHYLLYPGMRGHGLDSMAMDLLGHQMISYGEVTGGGKIDFSKVDTKLACRYSAEDADATQRLFEVFSPDLDAKNLRDFYEKVERPLLPILVGMERNGVKVDRAVLEELTRLFDELIKQKEQEAFEIAGEEFNLASPRQLGVVLFEKMGLPKGRKTSQGYSTDSSVLEKLTPFSPLPEVVLDYRQAAKLKSTYTDALVKLIDPRSGRIHTSFNQTVTITGRLSSSEPNLQNIPIRSEAGRMIRRAFVPEDGNLFVGADYSQVELRILAHLSKDPILIDAFRRGEDIHARTAREVFGGLAAITPEMRQYAKTINFGIVYGQTAFGLAQQLNISQGEARRFIDNYFARYSQLKRYMDSEIENARDSRTVRTIFGRSIPLEGIDEGPQAQRRHQERVAVNAPIQGSSADITKLAMIAVDAEIKRSGSRAKMILQVHDELLFEVPAEEAEELRVMVKEKMENVAHLDVPLVVDAHVGANWDEAH